MTDRTKNIVFINGKVWTGDAKHPVVESVAVQKNIIVFVGNNSDGKKWIGADTEIIDLKGRLLLPGFNDGHVHFSTGGFSLIELDLRSAKNHDELVQLMNDYVQKIPPGIWITGGNWDHESYPDQAYPNRWLLDAGSGDHPVLVNRLDGHVAVANSLALQIAGITKETEVPAGGYIEKDPQTGEPTGVLKDAALDMVTKHIPPPSDSMRMKAIRAAMHHAAQLGITSVQDMSAELDFSFYQQLLHNGELTCRIMAVMPIKLYGDLFHRIGIQYHFGYPFLRIGGVKNFSDGSMGAGSALLFEPYNDRPETSGLAIYPKEELTELTADAHQKDLQIFTHAIGDKANRWVLDAYETTFKRFGVKEMRHRIEHAQTVTEEDLPRFAQLNIIPVIQPSHCIDDMRWSEKRIGLARSAISYRFQSFVDAGIHVVMSTDWPVETLDPLLSIYAAVTREYIHGGPEGGWFPKEKVSVEQAVRSYTYDAAFAEHEEMNKGTIEVGKLADMVILNKDIFTIPAKEILQTKVDMTMVDGRIVFNRE